MCLLKEIVRSKSLFLRAIIYLFNEHLSQEFPLCQTISIPKFSLYLRSFQIVQKIFWIIITRCNGLSLISSSMQIKYFLLLYKQLTFIDTVYCMYVYIPSNQLLPCYAQKFKETLVNIFFVILLEKERHSLKHLLLSPR